MLLVSGGKVTVCCLVAVEHGSLCRVCFTLLQQLDSVDEPRGLRVNLFLQCAMRPHVYERKLSITIL